jgi:hypothetical protein
MVEGGSQTLAVALLGVVMLGAVELAHAHQNELVVFGVVRLSPTDRVAGERELRRARHAAELQRPGA